MQCLLVTMKSHGPPPRDRQCGGLCDTVLLAQPSALCACSVGTRQHQPPPPVATAPHTQPNPAVSNVEVKRHAEPGCTEAGLQMPVRQAAASRPLFAEMCCA